MKRLLSLLALSATMLVATAQEKYLLRLTPEVGKTYSYPTTTKTSTEMNQGGQSIQMDLTMQMTVDLKALEKVGKDYKMSMTTNQVQASVEVMGQTQDMTAMIAPQINGKSVFYTHNELGKTVGEIDASALGSFAKDMDLSSLFNAGVTYPEKAIAVGESWQSESVANSMKVVGTHTLKEVTAEAYIIVSTAVYSHVEGTKYISGTATSESKINRKTGMNIPGTTTINSRIETEVTAGEKPVVTTTTMTM